MLSQPVVSTNPRGQAAYDTFQSEDGRWWTIAANPPTATTGQATRACLIRVCANHWLAEHRFCCRRHGELVVLSSSWPVGSAASRVHRLCAMWKCVA
eukprot:scaffold143626_cov22-Tisochrysis_lutea.AAC.1